MSGLIAKLVSAWPLVARRALAHWRLLSAVIIGVLMASAILSGTVIYFDALRGLALKSSLSKLTANETNILVQAQRGPTSFDEAAKVSQEVNDQIDSRLAWMLSDRVRGGKSLTFYATLPGEEELAGEDDGRSYFAYLPRLFDHVTLLPGGSLPREQALSAPGEPLVLEAIVPAEAVAQFGIGVGDQLSAIPYWEDRIPYARVIITGLFERKDPSNGFWHLSDTIFEASASDDFRTIEYFVSEKTFMEVLGGAFRDLDTTYAWLLEVNTAKLKASNSTDARVGLRLAERRLDTSLHAYRQLSSLDEALEEYDERLFFAKLPMFVILILIAVVILYYVVTVSSLLVEQQRGELALLRSRGASPGQLLAVFALEGATISILAVAVAPIVAAFVISFLGYTPAFSGLSDGDRLPVIITRGAYMMSALGGALSFAALMIPAVQASRVEVAQHRQREARPTDQPFFQRYYLDVLLLAISVLLFQQLQEQGSVVAVGVFGEVTTSQLLLAVPALILVALAMVLLRLFPLSIRFLSGDSPALLHLVVAGGVLILGPSIAVSTAVDEGGWQSLAQIALLAALAGSYWMTQRVEAPLPKLVGMSAQAGAVAAVLTIGPSLPNQEIFVPLLIAIVPAQLLFILLGATVHRAPVGVSIGLWQMARSPTHYARLSLLLILMAGLGIFAASFGGTLERSFTERALYATGADIRVEGVRLNSTGVSRPVVPAYADMAGVAQVSPAFRGHGTDLSKLLGESYTMFAVDTDTFEQVAWYREDFSDRSLASLMSSLDTIAPSEGIVLPANAQALGATFKTDRPRRSIAVTVRIKDANDRYFTYTLGNLESSAWLQPEVSLERRSRFATSRFGVILQPAAPLTLVTFAIHETIGINRLRAGSLLIDNIFVRTENGEIQVIESFEEPSRWSILRAASESFSDELRPSNEVLNGGSAGVRFIWSEGFAIVSRGIYLGPPSSPVPVIASTSFLENTGHAVGDEFEVTVGGHRVQLELIDAVDYFPTLETTRKRGYLIASFATISERANRETTAGELKPNEMWLSTRDNGPERAQLISDLRGQQPYSVSAIHDQVASLADSKVDPLVKAGWRALLFIAFASVLILSGIGFLTHAYVSFRDREAQFALMRTIGFTMRQLITLVWLEQVLVIVAGLAVGTWIGRELGAVIMPFLGHDDRGSQVLPPFVIEISWGTLAITYAAMAVVFMLIITGVIWFIRKISLQRILRLGEM